MAPLIKFLYHLLVYSSIILQRCQGLTFKDNAPLPGICEELGFDPSALFRGGVN